MANDLYLSRLILNPRSRDVRRDLANCQELHRTILSAFPKTSSNDGGARNQFGVLYRIETSPRMGSIALLVQSKPEPDWKNLMSGYLADTVGDVENPACKRIDGKYQALEEGLTLTFRLRANPTRKIDTRTGPDGRRRNGKRVELRKEEDQIAWMKRKAELSGFRVLSVRVDANVPNLRAIPQSKETGWRQAVQREGGTTEKNRLTFGSVLFEGELIITDADLFRQALENGIGSGKAYGFGLLSIARSIR